MTLPSTEELKRLIADASPGPWDYTTFCKHDGSPIKTVADIEETVAASARYSDRCELFGVTLREDEGTVVCYTGNGPRAEHNAALMALSADLAREVVQLQEKIAEFKDAFELWKDVNKNIWHGFKSSKLDAAISAICKEP